MFVTTVYRMTICAFMGNEKSVAPTKKSGWSVSGEYELCDWFKHPSPAVIGWWRRCQRQCTGSTTIWVQLTTRKVIFSSFFQDLRYFLRDFPYRSTTTNAYTVHVWAFVFELTVQTVRGRNYKLTKFIADLSCCQLRFFVRSIIKKQQLWAHFYINKISNYISLVPGS